MIYIFIALIMDGLFLASVVETLSRIEEKLNEKR